MRRALLLAAIAMTLGCVGEMDYASNVHDLRVLAMEATPSEVYVGSGLPYFRVRALVADPGYSRELGYRFSTCPKPSNLRCDGQEDEIVLGEGTIPGEVAEVEFLAPMDQDFMNKAADSYRGFGGLPLLVSLRVTASDEEAFGGKRVLLQLPPPMSVEGQSPNRNPGEPQVLLAGTPMPADKRTEIRGSQIQLDVIPVAPGEKEQYQVPTFDGSARTLRESFTYSWFSTKGHFQPEQTGQFNVLLQKDDPTQTTLVIPEGEEPGKLTIWVVVRDGRGGETWTKRAATWLGP